MTEVKSLFLIAVRSAFGPRVPTQFHTVPAYGSLMRLDAHPLSPSGIESASRLLCVLRMQNPEIDFCPMLPDVGALHYCMEAQSLTCDAQLALFSIISTKKQLSTRCK